MLSVHADRALSFSARRSLRPCKPRLPPGCCQFSSTAQNSARPTPPGRKSQHPEAHSTPAPLRQHAAGRAEKKPSLIEQLFPEESKRYEEQQKALRDVPRLPLDPPRVKGAVHRKQARSGDLDTHSIGVRRLRRQIEATEEGTSVLVLRNAGINLTEEDFRRLIPQGRHIEGWTLEQGDILKVIPGRDLGTLAHQNVYYLLFSSPMGAFIYQGHASRIHGLAVLHTPASMSSPIPPPPGYIIEGLDVHAALEAYALVPPTQRLELRQLKPPLSPLMQSIARHQGYPSILKRKGKMPFEARLTMEGPQLGPSAVRHIMMQTGKSRALSWSGGDNMNLSITRWRSIRAPSAHDESVLAQHFTESEPTGKEVQPENSDPAQSDPSSHESAHKMRPAPVVYIVGFHTERAAQSFVRYWHRRPLECWNEKEVHTAEGDTPPVANVELMW